MPVLPQLDRHSFGLLTDLYQLTMAYSYWKQRLAGREAVFHLTFRQCPFAVEELLVPVFRNGACDYRCPPAADARNRAMDQLQRLGDSVRRLNDPASYPVGLDANLNKKRTAMVDAARRENK
jgi:hypothetical protein